ncbi:hypothetical protein NUW58_g6832 [Xylaria curta]|uniref:Uncharacterized protein n=1 Tax=Xylaria curta TaxID=42375 RepID=A0ACC1NNL2_9PEZI|nr:hypothetical protein NUW58_g6832 [Xylaria curta]
MPVDIPANEPSDGQELAGAPGLEEVICILKRHSSTKETYEILSLSQEEYEGKPSFSLRRSSYARGDDNEAEALQRLIGDFGITDSPEHLRARPGRRVHVVVSTHSGTGLSTQFYDKVLAPLLEAVGLSGQPERIGAEQQGSYHLLVTQDAESVKRFAQDLSSWDGGDKDVEHTVVLLSGDGGIVDMLNGEAPCSGFRPRTRSTHFTARESCPATLV